MNSRTTNANEGETETGTLDSVNPGEFPFGVTLVVRDLAEAKEPVPTDSELERQSGYLQKPVVAGQPIRLFRSPERGAKSPTQQTFRTPTIAHIIRGETGRIVARTGGEHGISYELIARSEHPDFVDAVDVKKRKTTPETIITIAAGVALA